MILVYLLRVSSTRIWPKTPCMRFLDTKTCQFVDLTDTTGVSEYAILSHTWDSRGEQTFQDLKRIQDQYTLKASSPLMVW